MNDKTQSSNNLIENPLDGTSPTNREELTEDRKSKSPRNGDSQQEDRQRIFAELFSTVMDGFGKRCEEQNIELAVAIAIHPSEKTPLIFIRGHEFDIARLLAEVLRNMKQKFQIELTT